MPARTILLVDDDDEFRSLLGMRLEKAGYRILHAVSGARATALVESDAPDLLLMDIQMPGMDGPATQRWLQGSMAARKTPVVFLSGMPEDQVGKILPKGPNIYFMRKPPRMERLLALVRHLLEEPGSSEEPTTLDLSA